MFAFIVHSVYIVYIRTPLMFPLSINCLPLKQYLCLGRELGEGVSGKNAFMCLFCEGNKTSDVLQLTNNYLCS